METAKCVCYCLMETAICMLVNLVTYYVTQHTSIYTHVRMYAHTHSHTYTHSHTRYARTLAYLHTRPCVYAPKRIRTQLIHPVIK